MWQVTDREETRMTLTFPMWGMNRWYCHYPKLGIREEELIECREEKNILILSLGAF